MRALLALSILALACAEVNVPNGVFGCSFDRDCPPQQVCGPNGLCLYACRSDDDCPLFSQICGSNGQCVMRVMGMDGGAPRDDAALDGSFDAGVHDDAGMDASVDAGMDGGHDSGFDAGDPCSWVPTATSGCSTMLGYAWDGTNCSPLIGCMCTGPHCDRVKATALECAMTNASCIDCNGTFSGVLDGGSTENACLLDAGQVVRDLGVVTFSTMGGNIIATPETLSSPLESLDSGVGNLVLIGMTRCPQISLFVSTLGYGGCGEMFQLNGVVTGTQFVGDFTSSFMGASCDACLSASGDQPLTLMRR